MAIDTTRPSVSRIYDYVLGGHHNFEADRAAAEKILSVFPSYPTWARINRWFLQLMARRWAEEGHTAILDLGSGMPTAGHFHTSMPAARVLYTDNDAMTVAYANDVLGNNPLVSFREADVREPGAILAAADQHLGTRLVAIGCIGISYFVDDESLAQLMQALHRWAAPGSVLALSYIHVADPTAHGEEIISLYQRYSGAKLYVRSPEIIKQICQPWKLRENEPLSTFLGMNDALGEVEREGMGADMFGAVFEHVGAV